MSAAAAGPRVAVASQGDPSDPTTFSGAPAALLDGLRARGVEAVAVPGVLGGPLGLALLRAGIALRLRPADLGDLRGAIRREHQAAALGPLVEAARDARIALGLRRAGRLDGVVQHGTEYRLPRGTRSVTYEDATTVAARRAYAWPHHAGLRAADHRRHDARAGRAYARAVACCAMSHWAARSIVEDFGVPAERVHVVGVGAVRRLRPPADRDWSAPRLLFVGFAWERKNGPAVVRAFARLRAEQPAATLDVVGDHPPLAEPGVTGHGPIALDDPAGAERLQALFDRATCFVMPSLHEPGGQVFIEAGSAGVPSVGTTNGGAATVIGNGGRVVDPDDDAALLQALRELSWGEAAAAAGGRAQAHAALLTWELVAGRLLRALWPDRADADGLPGFL